MLQAGFVNLRGVMPDYLMKPTKSNLPASQDVYLNQTTRQVTWMKKPAETYDTWKEKKLIQEFNQRRQELSDQSIKEKLSQHITNGRRELNELAVKNWLKKKEQERKEKDKKCEPLRGTESHIIHKRRNTITYSKPMVVNKLNDVIKSNLEQSDVRVDCNKNNYESLTSLYDINTNNSNNKDRGAGDYDKNDFSQTYKVKFEPQQQGIEQESVDEKRYKTEPIDSSDQRYKNKNYRISDEYYKLLDDYYYNNCESLQDTSFDSAFDRTLSFDREYSNKISFNEWLRKKNRLFREKKECELRAKMLKEEEKIHKKLMSKRALENWYVRNACLTFKRQMPMV